MALKYRKLRASDWFKVGKDSKRDDGQLTYFFVQYKKLIDRRGRAQGRKK